MTQREPSRDIRPTSYAAGERVLDVAAGEALVDDVGTESIAAVFVNGRRTYLLRTVDMEGPVEMPMMDWSGAAAFGVGAAVSMTRRDRGRARRCESGRLPTQGL